MKRYSLTSTAFNGEVIFEFNEFGLLEKFDLSAAELSEKQQLYILRDLPRELPELNRVLGDSKTAKLTEVTSQITFAMFWDRYNEKSRSSKKKSEKRWDRMSKTNQFKAYHFIFKYESNLRPGTVKKYAETYLNDELWNN